MNRRVQAILISVPKPSRYVTRRIPGADEALDRFDALLNERFTDPAPTTRILKGPAANQDNVTTAFDDACEQLSGDDLFVVLFIGHGRKSDGDEHAYQAWALDDSEFSDRQLADYLSKLERSVEVVIISDSCYGAGIAKPGPTALRVACAPLTAAFDDVRDTLSRWPRWLRYRALQLSALASAWSPAALLRAASRPTALATLNDMVCISAAAWWDEVKIAAIPRLIDMTIEAARNNATHGALADAFYETAVPGATFQLHARPNDRMCQPLLATQSAVNPLAEEASMTAESLQPPLTHFAFINYGDKTTTVSLNLKEDVGLNEIVPDGDVEGGALLSARDASGNCTLSLKPQVVAGFTARTAVTFKLISPRIDVVSWAGKDPPTPPPPVLPRYEDTGDFVEQFEALLGVADADDQGKGDRVVPARKSG